MKKLLFILAALFTLSAQSQVLFPSLDTIRRETIPGSGGIQALLYLPKDHGSIPFWQKRLTWYLSGDGEKWATASDTAKMWNNGPIKEIRSGAFRPGYGHIYVTFQRSGNFYVESDFDNAINYIKGKYLINNDQNYGTGYSSGSSSIMGWMNYKDTLFAAVLPVAGGKGQYSSITFNSVKVKKNWLWVVGSLGDALQGYFGGGSVIFDTSINGQGLSPKMVKNEVFMTASHGQVHDSVFKRFVKYEKWLDLHHRSLDTTAKRYVDSLERGFDWDFAAQCDYNISFLSEGSFKNSLSARVEAARIQKYGLGYKVIHLNMANSAKTHPLYKTISTNTTGTTVTGLIDYRTGLSTGIGFTIVAQGGSNAKRVTFNSDHYGGAPDSTMGESFEVYGVASPKQLRLTNVPEGTYTVMMHGTSLTVPGGEPGWIATLQSRVQRMNQQNRNTHQYGVWDNVQPVSNAIDWSITGLSSTGAGQVGLITLIQYGEFSGTNSPPIANAGTDKSVILPTTSVAMTGSGFDSDGTIAGYAWSQISGPTTVVFSNAAIATPTVSNLALGTYQLRLTVTDDDGEADTDDVIISVSSSLDISAGIDLMKPMGQASQVASPFQLNMTVLAGTASTYSWTRLSGPGSVSITGNTTATPTITGAVVGYHYFRVAATGPGSTADADTVMVWVRNLQEDKVLPCRVGTKQLFKVGQTIGGGITTTSFSMSYVQRDNLIPGIMGGDTIMIMRNPNNGGDWTRFTIGDLRAECPIIIVPDSSGTGIVNFTDPTYPNNTGNFNIASADSNSVKNLRFVGTANYAKKGVVYGFQIGNPYLDTAHWYFRGISGGNLDNVYFGGFYFNNCATGISIKVTSDSTKPWKYFDTWRNTLVFEDMYFGRGINEDGYIGGTNAGGTLQGNDGPIQKGNYVSWNRIIVDSTGWDGLQSSFYTFASYKNCVILHTGRAKQSGQIGDLFHGGGVNGGLMDSSYIRFSEGGPTILGDGTFSMRDNIVGDFQQMYISQARDVDYPNTGLTYGPLKVFTERNIFFNQTGSSYGIAVANTGGENFLPGAIRNNTFVTSKTLSQFVNSQYGDTITGNTVTTVMPTLPNTAAKQMYDFMVANPTNRKPSFYDIFNPIPAPNVPPVVNAGTDVTITLPTSVASLSATATDPDGTISTYAWTKVSGTSGGTITSASSANTTVTGLTAGVRTYRIIVTDNNGATAFDDVVITTQANQPPTAFAGNDTTITLPAGITLVGIGNDPEGGTLTYEWVVISGPNSPSLSNDQAATTDVLGLAVGTYVFRLYVTDNAGNTVTDTITVTVLPASLLPPETFRLRGGWRFKIKP